ncbi:MAG: response regulator transcription factor [Thiobacillus sp.]|nr:response regulator transcription factor [Gammaproteobacteria bacterium]MBU4499935.1 response regulator transcription factor [Gammaproteobacteria bacterium]MDO9008193.1 response regulator transcription factor [Thiobacillus sp.]MDP1925006.1 response regulator transcription factor [Thiobacillus sp.]MDP3126815.1 response regulator transcription factor [Thiobacillus sp.]
MSINVLIVDDHVVMAEGLRYLIDAQSDLAVVGCVNDGREALREVVERVPDVVVMDIAMPELNGIEATHLIHERSPDTQIVMLSMHSNREYVLRALQAGARGYVLKKNAAAEVLTAIRSVYSGRRYLSSQITESVIEDYLRSSRDDPLDALSSRERQVLQLLVEGKSTVLIAESLSLSPKTVETYRARVMQKLDIGDMPGLVKFAIQHGLTTIE